MDLSPAMIERLEARARKEGLSDLETHVMDGHVLDLEDDTFDLAGSQFGVMLFPDLPRGLWEMVRVTKPGGRVLMIAYGPPARVEFLTFFLAALESVVPGFTGPPMDPPPLPFQVADPDVLVSRMREAGLQEVRGRPRRPHGPREHRHRKDLNRSSRWRWTRWWSRWAHYDVVVEADNEARPPDGQLPAGLGRGARRLRLTDLRSVAAAPPAERSRIRPMEALA